MIRYIKFLPEDEYVSSFTKRGMVVPPFIVLMPYVERNGVKGYLVPCKPDDPNAEKIEEDDPSQPV